MSISEGAEQFTRRRPRVAVWRVLFVALVSVALVGCGSTASSGGGSKSASPPTTASSASSKPFFVTANDPWGSGWSYNPFNPLFVSTVADDMTFEQLALQTPAGLATFKSQLATSWSLKGETFTVNLRHNAKWQDGTPVTSADVLDSVELQGVTSGAEWQDISAVSAPSRYQVVYTLVPGIATSTAEVNILTMFVLPHQTWSQFLKKPGLLATIESYYKVDRANPTAAPSTAAGKVISDLDTQVIHFKPTTFIGDGPFEFVKTTIAEAKLTKNPYFYNAKDVKVSSLIWQETPNANTGEGEELTGSVDYTWNGYTGATWTQILKTPNMHIIARPNYADYAVYFNSRHYPLNLLKVRQALAYILHNKKLLEANDGVPNYDEYVKYPSIIYNPVSHLYLTTKQVDSLNPYNYNPAKATSLLESAGFHKRGGEWYEPNGKQFTLTMGAPAGWSGVELTPKYIAGVLDNFGIKTQGSAVEQPGYWSQMQQGQFELDWGWGGFSTDPLQNYNYVIGPNLNFSTTGTYKGDPGIGFGPNFNVPGLGKVNIVNTIEQEATTVSYGSKMKQLVWDWTKFINQQVPIVMFGDKNVPFQYSTARYDWPSGSSPDWSLMGLNIEGGLATMFANGLIHPK